MAINVSFNGATIYKPGAYSEEFIDLGGGFPLSPAGIVAIFGESSAGAPGSAEPNIKNNVFSPEQIPQIQAKYGTGNLVDACSFLFSPATDGAIPSGAQAVYIYKTNASTRAALSTSFGNVRANQYGTSGNLITYMNVLLAETPAQVSGSVTVSGANFAQGDILNIAQNGMAPVSYTIAASASPAALVVLLNAAFSGMAFSLSSATPGPANKLIIAQDVAALSTHQGWGRSFEILAGTANAAFGVSSGLYVPAVEPSATITINNTLTQVIESGTEGGNVVMTIGYDNASATAATVTINGSNVILAQTGGPDAASITLPLAGFVTLNDLAAGIGAMNTSWHAAVTNSLYGQLLVGSLDQVSAVGALSVSGGLIEPARIKKDAADVAAFFAASSNVSLIAPIPSPAPASPLASAATYGILANSAITTSGTSTVNGDLGESPGSTVTGTFTTSGATNLGNAAAATARADAQAAYAAFLALPSTPISAVLDGQSLGAGVYREASSTFALATSTAGTLTLHGSATDVFVFICSSTLTTGAGGVATINLTGGALARNVYWLCDTSATINSGNAGTFVGTILARASITDSTGGTVEGRLIAGLGATGAITLSVSDVINVPAPAPGVSADVGLPAAAAAVLGGGIALTGGTKGATHTADIVNALTAFTKLRVNSIVPLFSRDASADIADNLTDSASDYTILGIQQAVKTHLSLMATTKRRSERQGYESLKDTYVNCKARVGLLADAREQLVIQDVLQVNSLGNIMWFQPWAFACMLAGARGGAPIGTPLTFKFMNCSGIRQTAQPMSTPEADIVQDFDPDTMFDDAIQSGITFMEAPQTGGFRVVVDNTTYGRDGNWVFNRGNVLYAADTVAFNFRTQLEAIYVGVKNTVKASEVKNVCEAILSTFLAQGITVSTPDAPNGFKSLVVQINGNTINISVTVKLVEGIDFVLAQITLQRAQSAA